MTKRKGESMMKTTVIHLDAPERSHVMAGGAYGVLCFFSLPFIFLLFSIGLDYEPTVASWFEIAFHILNIIIVGSIFREYLSDSMLNVRIRGAEFVSVVAISVGLMLGVGLVWHFLALFTGLDIFYIAGFGTLPLSEMDIFSLSSNVVLGNKIFGTLCMVLIVPVTTSCLYYAVGFVPAYNVRPWLGYLTLAAAVAFPRICNGMTHWDPATEMVLYVAQLPVHIIGCWAYKKMDTIWAPIVALAITNLIASVLMMIFYTI